MAPSNKEHPSTCPFCRLDREIIEENKWAFSIRDGFPISKGHTLVVSKSCKSNFFDLTLEEQQGIFDWIRVVQKRLSESLRPDGFNVGWNVNKAAGQTGPHVHVHVIPRWENDTENPRGGVRKVIPEKADYLALSI